MGGRGRTHPPLNTPIWSWNIITPFIHYYLMKYSRKIGGGSILGPHTVVTSHIQIVGGVFSFYFSVVTWLALGKFIYLILMYQVIYQKKNHLYTYNIPTDGHTYFTLSNWDLYWVVHINPLYFDRLLWQE